MTDSRIQRIKAFRNHGLVLLDSAHAVDQELLRLLDDSRRLKLLFQIVDVPVKGVVDRLKELIDFNRLLRILQLLAVSCVAVGKVAFPHIRCRNTILLLQHRRKRVCLKFSLCRRFLRIRAMADKIMRHLMDQRGELLRISQLVIDRDMTCARVIKAAKCHGIYIPFLDLNADVLTVALDFFVNCGVLRGIIA